MDLETGSYIGNGSSQAIALPWNASAVFVFCSKTKGPAASQGMVFKLATMPGDQISQAADSCSNGTGLTLSTSAFIVNSNPLLNASGVKYYWLAVRAGSTWIEQGSYVGNGTSQSIPTSSQRVAKQVLIFTQATTPEVEFKQDTMSAAKTLAWRDGGFLDSDSAVVLQTGAISVAETPNAHPNVSGATNHWLAFFDFGAGSEPCVTAVDQNTLSGLDVHTGRQPKAVFLGNGFSLGTMAFKTNAMPAGQAGRLQADATYIANFISELADGYRLEVGPGPVPCFDLALYDVD